MLYAGELAPDDPDIDRFAMITLQMSLASTHRSSEKDMLRDAQ